MIGQAVAPKEGELCSLCGLQTSDPQFHIEIPVCTNCMKQQAVNLKQMRDSRTRFYPEIDEITKKLFLGNQDASLDKELLKSKGVTHILIAGRWLEKVFPDDFTYFSIDIDDSTCENIYLYFKDCFDFIKNSEICFVHCAAGVSRSASIVISFLMRDLNMKFEDAHKFVKTKRKVIFPNSGFIKQLKALEEELGIS